MRLIGLRSCARDPARAIALQPLGQAGCPLAIASGDLVAVERYVAMLAHPGRHGEDGWQTYVRCFQGMLLIKRDGLAEGLAMLRDAVAELRTARFIQYYTPFLAALAEGLATIGEAVRAVVDETPAQSEKSEEPWILAELLRVKGEIVLLHAPRDAAVVAERHFQQSLEVALRQGALAWELRTAMSLARLGQRPRRTSHWGFYR